MLSSVLGLPCWEVRWDCQVGLDMNFGPPRLEIREPRVSTANSPRVRAQFVRRGIHLHGSHWLVISPRTWRLELADALVVRDSSSARRLDMAVARLRGEILNGLIIDPRTSATTFHFDLGARIIVRTQTAPAEPSEEELWSIHNRSRFVYVCRGGQYSTDAVERAPTVFSPIGSAGDGPVIIATDETVRLHLLGTLHPAAV